MEGNEDHTPTSMEDILANRSGGDSVESTEQQATEDVQTTEAAATTETTQKTSSETQEGEITEEDAATETTEQTTEAVDGEIINLVSEEESTENQELTENSESQEQSLDFGEILNGEFENAEDLGSYIEEQNSRIEELEAANEPKFANDTVQKLNEYVNNGGTAADFMRVQGVNVDSMSPVDKLVTELVWKTPNLSESQAKEHILDKYGIEEGEDGSSNTSALIASNEAGLKIKAIQADDTPGQAPGMSEDEWNSKQSESQSAENEALMQQDEARMGEWKAPISKTIDNLKEEGVLIDLGDGTAFKYNFNADGKYLETLTNQAEEALFLAGSSVKESPELAKQMIESQFISDNLGSIVKSYGNKIANSKNEENFRESNNPSPIARGDKRSSESEAPLSNLQVMMGVTGK